MDAKQVLNRIGKLQEFEVIVTMPEVWRFKGVVPFDMSIVGNQAFITMLAETIEEATHRANSYINSLTEDE